MEKICARGRMVMLLTFNQGLHDNGGSIPSERTNFALEAHVDGYSAFNGRVEGSRPSRRTNLSVYP